MFPLVSRSPRPQWKKEKAQVFTRFDEDISELDRRASRHRRDIEKVDSKVDKMAAAAAAQFL